MSFWDDYWDHASDLREELIVSLKSKTDMSKLAMWINHLCALYEYVPEILDRYFSKEEALFHFSLEHLGLLDGSELHRVNALELSNILKNWPKFKEYCEASCVGNGAWAQLKFKQPIEHGDGFELIKEALTMIKWQLGSIPWDDRIGVPEQLTAQELPVSNVALINLSDYLECRKSLIESDGARLRRLDDIQRMITKEIVNRFELENESFDDVWDEVSTSLRQGQGAAAGSYGAMPFVMLCS